MDWQVDSAMRCAQASRRGYRACHPPASPACLSRASGNSFVFRGLREGAGGVGSYHYPFSGGSKLIAFDFVPPPPTGATCCDIAATWCRKTHSPLSSLACAFTRSGLVLFFDLWSNALETYFFQRGCAFVCWRCLAVGNPSSSWRLA